jgi:hypothetical protein
MKFNLFIKKADVVFILIFFIFLYILKSSDFNQNVFIPSVSYLFLLFLFFVFNRFRFFTNKKGLEKVKYFNLASYVLMFLLTLITQNYLLHYEVISWDVSSYLVAASDLGRGNLPYVNQWESKGPLFVVFYYLFILFSDGDYVKFKILNDSLIYLSSIIIFHILKTKSQDFVKPLFGSLFFILLMSKDWYIAEISEIYYLPFLGLATFHIFSKNKNNYFYLGLLSSISTLVNQSAVLFFVTILLYLFTNQKNNIFNSLYKLFLGFLTPHLFFVIIYFYLGHIDIYIANYFTIPISYSSENLSSFYELIVWIREYFRYEEFLYFSIILTIVLSIISLNKIKSSNLFIHLNLMAGMSLYFIAGHNYYHHLLYFLFFLPLIMIFSFSNKILKIFYIQITISAFVILSQTLQPSIMNLKDTTEVISNYPLYNLANELRESNNIDEAEILALDYVLLLYYLDKPNYSYIVHPSNHFEDYIVNELIRLGYVQTNEYNHISYLIEEEPEIIICNSTLIVYGIPTKVDFYNCMVSDYKKNYLRVDTLSYQNDRKIDYYFDPYKELRVFIKQED